MYERNQYITAVPHLLALPFRGTFTKLCDFSHDKPTLRLWEVSFVQVVQMRGDHVFLLVYEPVVGCILRGFVDVIEKRGDSRFGLAQ